MKKLLNMVQPANERPKCLVTGGAGFLGRHVVDALSGKYEVSIFDVRESGDPSAKAIIGDIRKLDSIAAACKGGQIIHQLPNTHDKDRV